MACKTGKCVALTTKNWDKFRSFRPDEPVTEINEAAAKRVLGVLSFGLPGGLGVAAPGRMCVEAAVAYSMGYDHNDKPECVLEEVSEYKIWLNDRQWSSDMARARGLRAVAIAQLGSNGLSSADWDDAVAEAYLTKLFPLATKLRGRKRLGSKARDLQRNVETALYNALKITKSGDGYDDAQELVRGSVTTRLARALGYRGPNAIMLLGATLAVEALTALKVKGTKYLYLLKKPAKKAKR